MYDATLPTLNAMDECIIGDEDATDEAGDELPVFGNEEVMDEAVGNEDFTEETVGGLSRGRSLRNFRGMLEVFARE